MREWQQKVTALDESESWQRGVLGRFRAEFGLRPVLVCGLGYNEGLA